MIPVLAIELAFTILSAMNIFLTYMKIRRGLSKSILNIQSSLLRTIPPIAKCHVPYKSVLFLEADGWEPSGSLMVTFCFDGLEPSSVVAVSTVGCKRGHEAETFFMRGYNVLLERIHPRLVLCVGTPFIGMAPATTSLIVYPYEYPRKKRD